MSVYLSLRYTLPKLAQKLREISTSFFIKTNFHITIFFGVETKKKKTFVLVTSAYISSSSHITASSSYIYKVIKFDFKVGAHAAGKKASSEHVSRVAFLALYLEFIQHQYIIYFIYLNTHTHRVHVLEK